MKRTLPRLIALFERSPRRALWWISALMVLITCARYAQSPPRPTDDQTSNWWPVVNAVLDGRGFVSCLPEYFPFCTEDSPTAMREPLPLLMHAGVAALCGRSLWAASAWQALLNIVAAWMLFYLVRRLGGTRTGLVAAMLWALYIPAYWDVINIAGDQLAVVAVLGAALMFERSMRTRRGIDLLLAGLMFGAAALCRSASIAFGAVAGVTVLLRDREVSIMHRLRSAGLLATGIALALAPWALRNQRVFHHLFLGSTLSGYNLFRHNSAITSENYCHFVAAEEGQHYLDSLITAHPELTHRENEAEMNALYAAAGKATIAQHPGRYLVLSGYRALPLWTNWGVNAAYGKPFGAIDTAIALLQLVLLMSALLGFAQRPRWRWVIGAAIAVFCVMHMLVVCRLRFLIPAMPLVICLAALPLERLLPRDPDRPS